jgi:hypothetical protein
LSDLAFAVFIAYAFGYLGCYFGEGEAKTEERQKWCQHYHTEFKAVESCLDKPDYEKPDLRNKEG